MKWRQSYEAINPRGDWQSYSGVYDSPFWPSNLRGSYRNVKITPEDDEAKAYQTDIDEYDRLAKIYNKYAEKPFDSFKQEWDDIKGHYKSPEDVKEFLEVLRDDFITPEMLQRDKEERKKEEIKRKLFEKQLERGTKEAWEAAPDDFAKRFDIISKATQDISPEDIKKIDPYILEALDGIL